MPTVKDEPVKIAIATQPPSDQVGIAKDLELAKAALLYADEVEMVGLGVALFEELRQLTRGDIGAWGLVRALDDEALAHVLGQSSSDLPQNWRSSFDQLLNLDVAQLPDDQRTTILGLREQMAELKDGSRPLIDNILSGAGAAELATAIDAGAVRIAPLNINISTIFRGGKRNRPETDAQIADWLHTLLDRLKDRKVRVLFDKASAGLIEAMRREGRLPDNPQSVRLARQAALGAGLVARLPAFPQAPMDELLDLKKELVRPIAVYQGAIVRYSQQLPQVELGDDLDFEIGQLWQGEVAPSIDQLKEELAQHSLVRELAARADAKDIANFTWTSATGIGVGVVSQASLLHTAMYGALTGAPLLATTVMEAFRSRSTVAEEASRRDFFLLYESNRRLGS